MKKFLITSLLGIFLFAIASVNAATIQRDVGINTELKVSFENPVIIVDGSAMLPAIFCQRTEVLPFREATPIVRSSFAEFLWPMKGEFIYRNIYPRQYKTIYKDIPIDVGKFSRIKTPHFT